MAGRGTDEQLTGAPTLAAGGGQPPEDAWLPSPGEHIDRFIVLEPLGRGGMGAVVSAYDPHLDRRVAIKVVAPGRPGTGDTETRGRLLREARAMARLRHPNVISVYEAGEHRGRVYVVMEQIEGGNLRQALHAPGRSWREIVELFAAAGRGLAAAHAAGLVHRDFKPDNVLVDADGRVLVGDFGLVGRAGARVPSTGEEEIPLADRLTRADTALGTPAYMPPEQQLGRPVDARADQYALCAALYEALYGKLPFEAPTRRESVARALAGDLDPPPPGRKVPEWLHRVLARGLSANREDRYPSVEELLVELGADPEQSHRPGGLERTLLVVLLGAFVVAWGAAALGFDVELSYRLHYFSDVGFLLGLLSVGWLIRHAISRSRFNRQVFFVMLAGAVTIVALTAGGHLLGIPPDTLGSLHMLCIGSVTLAAAAALEVRLIVVGITYFTAYLVSAIRPELFLPACFLAHVVMAIALTYLFRARRR